jgi:hypothetical protein
MDFTLFAYEISPSGAQPCCFFEHTLEACRRTALEQRQELAGFDEMPESLGRITILECQMRTPTQAGIMAVLNAPDDPSIFFDSVVMHRKVVETI